MLAPRDLSAFVLAIAAVAPKAVAQAKYHTTADLVSIRVIATDARTQMSNRHLRSGDLAVAFDGTRILTTDLEPADPYAPAFALIVDWRSLLRPRRGPVADQLRSMPWGTWFSSMPANRLVSFLQTPSCEGARCEGNAPGIMPFASDTVALLQDTLRISPSWDATEDGAPPNGEPNRGSVDLPLLRALKEAAARFAQLGDTYQKDVIALSTDANIIPRDDALETLAAMDASGARVTMVRLGGFTSSFLRRTVGLDRALRHNYQTQTLKLFTLHTGGLLVSTTPKETAKVLLRTLTTLGEGYTLSFKPPRALEAGSLHRIAIIDARKRRTPKIKIYYPAELRVPKA